MLFDMAFRESGYGRLWKTSRVVLFSVGEDRWA